MAKNRLVWIAAMALAGTTLNAHAANTPNGGWADWFSGWRAWWSSHSWTSPGNEGTDSSSSGGTATGGTTSGGTDAPASDSGNGATSPAPVNAAPTISGSPVASVAAGSGYIFTPEASDADGDSLTFSVSNEPAWASFDSTSGTLSGTPSAADVGTYSNVTISVTDGQNTTSLSAFGIAVNQIAIGVVTLNWQAPTENTDGSALTNMEGYRIYEGNSPTSLAQLTEISPGLSSYVITDAGAGTRYYAITAYTSSGAESAWSNVVSKTLN